MFICLFFSIFSNEISSQHSKEIMLWIIRLVKEKLLFALKIILNFLLTDGGSVAVAKRMAEIYHR